MLKFESNVVGIPCIIHVTGFYQQEPLGRNAPTDLDCYGYVEIDFEVLDRKGYKAKWLEAKLNEDEISRIEDEIVDKMGLEEEL